MERRKRRQFSPDFKAEAVRLVKAGDRNLATVARDLDLTPSALREWVHGSLERSEASSAGVITDDEREELVRLRRENKRLLLEREILKKAAAFFAKENG
jgi:transposase-like protein